MNQEIFGVIACRWVSIKNKFSSVSIRSIRKTVLTRT